MKITVIIHTFDFHKNIVVIIMIFTVQFYILYSKSA